MAARERWEQRLAEGLNHLSDLGDESPPDLAQLQSLVLHVQREERRRLTRDLLLFWGCGSVVLLGVLGSLTAGPHLFLALQATAIPIVVWAALWQGRRQVAE